MRPEFTILGSTGFIGRRLSNTLISGGSKVWLPQRQSQEVFSEPLGVVFYCVGLTSDYLRRPFETIEAHICYLARLLQHAKYDRFVYLSSTRLYDGLDIKVAGGYTPLQLNPNNPRHLYNLSKAMGENICRTVVGKRASIARLSCVYDSSSGSPGFLSEILQRLSFERQLNLESSSDFIRDYITLDDTVSSLIAIGKHEVCDIFNVASGDNTSNQDIADTLRPFGVEIKFSLTGEQMPSPRCDINNLRQIGISPIKTIDALRGFGCSLFPVESGGALHSRDDAGR